MLYDPTLYTQEQEQRTILGRVAAHGRRRGGLSPLGQIQSMDLFIAHGRIPKGSLYRYQGRRFLQIAVEQPESDRSLTWLYLFLGPKGALRRLPGHRHLEWFERGYTVSRSKGMRIHLPEHLQARLRYPLPLGSYSGSATRILLPPPYARDSWAMFLQNPGIETQSWGQTTSEG